jgi:hypothetical protein
MVYYLTSAGSIFMNGPGASFLVSLGIEQVVDLATATMLYNYVAIGFILALAAMVGPRGEGRMCVVIPLFAGVFAWLGWLHGPNPTQTFAVIVITFLLGIAIYMNEQNRERYGVGGPGSKLMNIVYFIILFQVASGIVAGMNLFAMPAQQNPNMCVVGNNTWGATCNSNGLIDFSSSVGSTAGTGGFTQDILSVGAMMLSAGVAIVQMLITVGISIVAFPFVLNGIIAPIFPDIVSNSLYLVFMAGLEAVLLVNLTMALFAWFYPKLPAPEPI